MSQSSLPLASVFPHGCATRRSLFVLSLLVCLSGLVGCNNGPVVVVSVAGLMPAVKVLRISAFMPGTGRLLRFELHSGMAEFSLRLPVRYIPELELDIVALDANRCLVSEGHRQRLVVRDGMETQVGIKLTTCEFCWCYSDYPRPDELHAGWSASAKDSWMVGVRTQTQHWDGTTLAGAAAGKQSLFGIRGRGRDDVWAVGHDLSNADLPVLMHWDNKTWSALRSPTVPLPGQLFGVWTPGPSEVWAVGEGPLATRKQGIIAHWDGKILSYDGYPEADSLQDVWGTGQDLWAVGGKGRQGIILRKQGAGPFRTFASAPEELSLLWGSAADDIWAIGGPIDVPGARETGLAMHWNGTTWTSYPDIAAKGLYSIWGSGKNDVWAVGEECTVLHWDGTRWSQCSKCNAVAYFGVFGSGAKDVWIVGQLGTILHNPASRDPTLGCHAVQPR